MEYPSEDTDERASRRERIASQLGVAGGVGTIGAGLWGGWYWGDILPWQIGAEQGILLYTALVLTTGVVWVVVRASRTLRKRRLDESRRAAGIGR